MSSNAFDTVEKRASYGIGLQIGQQLKDSGMDGLDATAVVAGVQYSLNNNEPAIEVEAIHEALKVMYERGEAQRREQQEKLAAEGRAFLVENAKRDDVTITESGLQFEVLHQGDGKIPAKEDKVRVHYTGTLVDGTVFDSSVARGEPAEFPVGGVIPGWVEALTLMPVGSKWKLYIPHNLAYGERGAGAAIPPYSALVFEVELLDIL